MVVDPRFELDRCNPKLIFTSRKMKNDIKGEGSKEVIACTVGMRFEWEWQLHSAGNEAF